MKKTIFKGMATAMVTPMTPEGVDYEALGRFIDFQLASGINALVAVGTTGESATLTPEERKKVISFTIDRVAGRVPVIAGTGTNNTLHAIDYSVSAAQAGADALLVVTPYYNKATQNGLIAHFTAIADKVDKPIILYNVPSRTGCNLLPATVEKLAEHPNVAAIKEASGNMSQVVELFARYLDLINLLFCEVNPIPAKAAVSAMGYGKEFIRLPLTPMEAGNRTKLLAEMRKQGVAL